MKNTNPILDEVMREFDEKFVRTEGYGGFGGAGVRNRCKFGDNPDFDEEIFLDEVKDFIATTTKQAVEVNDKKWREETLSAIEEAFWDGVDVGGDDYAGEGFSPENYLSDLLKKET